MLALTAGGSVPVASQLWTRLASCCSSVLASAYAIVWFFSFLLDLADAQSVEARIIFSADSELLNQFEVSRALTVDVFWCSGDELSESRKVAAAEIASSVATYARITNKSIIGGGNPDVLIKSVRLRPLDVNATQRSEVALGDNAVLLPDNTEEVKFVVNAIVEFSGRNFKITQARDGIPNYLQFITCQDVDLEKVPPRIFIQTARSNQEGAAQDIVAEIRNSLNRVTVASGIEVMAEKSPNDSQVRYFFPEDESVARRVADAVGKVISKVPDVVYLPQLASPSSMGQVEVWLGQSVAAFERTSYLVCEGEYRNRCPDGSDWIPCYFSLDAWASTKADCPNFTTERLTTISGNRCGYSVTRVTCTKPN